MPLNLQTPRLTLRPISRSDLRPLHGIFNRPEVGRYLWDGEPVHLSTTAEYLERSARDFARNGLGIFGVRRKGHPALVGFCGFRRSGSGETEILYGLLPRWWNRGFASEAASACLTLAFREAGVPRVVAGVDAPNAASIKVLLKLGMKPAPERAPGSTGVLYYALSREEFERQPENINRSGSPASRPHPSRR